MEIRGFTMQYCKRRARSEKDKENQPVVKLNELQENYVSRGMTLICYYTPKAKLEKLSNKKK